MCANMFWLLDAIPNGMRVTDLPTNNEPLEVSRGTQGVAKKVGVSLLLLCLKLVIIKFSSAVFHRKKLTIIARKRA